MNRPNIIMISSDDQGYGDLSCMGSDFSTPNLDRLAASGARLTGFYSASPVCSPSRAAMLTGRYPGNAGVRSILHGHRTATGLSPKVPTIASFLKNLGYDTAIIGKWHLGLAEQSHPCANGFNNFYGFMAGCIDYYSHIFYWSIGGKQSNPTHDLWENNNEVYNNGRYFTELVTEKAVEYIQDRTNEQPFYLYLAYNAPHYPMHAPEKYLKRFDYLPRDRQIIAAMISAMDDGIGEVLNALIRKNALENTIIIFQSDNGPSRESRNWLDGTLDPYYGGSTGGLKGHKFSLYEGGIRVPAIVSWPGTIPDHQIISEPVCAIDWVPTLLSITGVDTGDLELDGLNILPVVINSAPSPHNMIFWEMAGQTAVRQGRYKLVINGVLVENEVVQAPIFLSDLHVDPSESTNLADRLPDVTRELTDTAMTWREKLEERWEKEYPDQELLPSAWKVMDAF